MARGTIMAWQKSQKKGSPWDELRLVPSITLSKSVKINENCFIRKQHKCGKVYGASKSCFIACPTLDELEPILELLSEKLARNGIEAIIAVKERVYGQDIFCTKICGKIIESKFCMVILDDAVVAGENIPNPNVYYEYGLMTSLRKHIVPLQREDLKLAFNIQSYDTIKYSLKNIGPELDRAIRDAIISTEEQEREYETVFLNDKAILQRLEIAGFNKSERWDDETIRDTAFLCLLHNERPLHLLLSRIDTEHDMQSSIDDLGVVIYRTEKRIRTLLERKTKLEEGSSDSAVDRIRNKAEIEQIDSYLSRMSKIIIGFIISPEIDPGDMIRRVAEVVDDNPRYEVAIGNREKITIRDIEVKLLDQSH
jgi:hypothetical protein